jgi:hypothetical protein
MKCRIMYGAICTEALSAPLLLGVDMLRLTIEYVADTRGHELESNTGVHQAPLFSQNKHIGLARHFSPRCWLYA